MKKILIITNNWLYDQGGRRISTSKIIDFLSHNGYNFMFVNFEVGTKKISKTEIKKNIFFNKKITSLTYFVKTNKRIIPYLKQISKKNKFDIIICCGGPHFDIMTIITIRLFQLFKKSKVILFSHVHPLKPINIFSFSIKDFLCNLGYYISAHFVYKLFDKIVSPSTFLAKYFSDHLSVNQKNVFVISHPIFNRRHISVKNNSLPLFNKKEKTIITVARLNIYQKDFYTLLRTLKELNNKISCRLIILGEGIDREKIIILAKKFKVYNKINLIGFKKNPIKYIKKADVFAFSSFFEGFGIVIVEAMMSKIPVVSTDCDFGPREILEDGKNGILVPMGDHKAMTNAIVKLLENNKLRKQYIKNGLNRAKYYDEEKSFRLWIQLLSEK